MPLDETLSEDGAALPELALPEEGTILEERYVVQKMLGSGGMGAVFAGQHLVVKRPCAIKFLRVELAGRSRSRSRFEREAELLGGLVHDNLTSVFDFGFFADKSPYLVMEYIDGQTLRRLLLEEVKIEPVRGLRLIKQVCAGLAFAHDSGIVHRDLKPDNLMVTSRSDGEEWVKILDFGIARAVDASQEASLTPTGADLGTPHYMSPEQARGEKNIDARADVYSIGVILYEMVTGKKPHPGDTYNQVIFHLLTEAPVPVHQLAPDCPAVVQQLIERCLSNNPDRRYADGAELEKAIAEALEKIGVDHLPGTLPSTRGLFWTGVAFGAATASMLAVAFALVGGGDAPRQELAATRAEPLLPSASASLGGSASQGSSTGEQESDQTTSSSQQPPVLDAAGTQQNPAPAIVAKPEASRGSRRLKSRPAPRRRRKPPAPQGDSPALSIGTLPAARPAHSAASVGQGEPFKFLTDNPYE